MTLRTMRTGYIPLVDAAPLIIAHELGFDSEEGMIFELHREPSWSALRDKLAFGTLDIAQMLAPMPVAMSMGLGGMPVPMNVLSVLSVNGTVIGVSSAVAAQMQQVDVLDAHAQGRALLAAVSGPLRIGVPFPFSMHAELLYYWFSALGVQAPADLQVRTVPPPLMAEALKNGEIDAFCVGEPWGSISVEQGVGEILLPGAAIWKFAPEKVLAARRDFVIEHPIEAKRCIRVLWRAARWLAKEENRMAASEMLARPDRLDVPAEVLERALSGRLTTTLSGQEVYVPHFVEFFDNAATFPWRSQALWIADRLAARSGLDRQEAARTARETFRSDLYRAALAPLDIDLPGASEKVEGALRERTAVASSAGTLFLGPDSFFDGQTFDIDNKKQAEPLNSAHFGCCDFDLARFSIIPLDFAVRHGMNKPCWGNGVSGNSQRNTGNEQGCSNGTAI